MQPKQYEYWNDEQHKWIGLVPMHYHLINEQEGRIFMYGNWYAIREEKLNSEQGDAVSDTTTGDSSTTPDPHK